MKRDTCREGLEKIVMAFGTLVLEIKLITRL